MAAKNWQSDPATIKGIIDQIQAAGFNVEVDTKDRRLRASGKGITTSVPYMSGQEASQAVALARKLGVLLKR